MTPNAEAKEAEVTEKKLETEQMTEPAIMWVHGSSKLDDGTGDRRRKRLQKLERPSEWRVKVALEQIGINPVRLMCQTICSSGSGGAN